MYVDENIQKEVEQIGYKENPDPGSLFPGFTEHFILFTTLISAYMSIVTQGRKEEIKYYWFDNVIESWSLNYCAKFVGIDYIWEWKKILMEQEVLWVELKWALLFISQLFPSHKMLKMELFMFMSMSFISHYQCSEVLPLPLTFSYFPWITWVDTTFV